MVFTRLVSFFKSSKRDLFILCTSLFNKNTPKSMKTMIVVAFLYLISPVDFLPDLIPGLGLMDDAVLVPGILFTILQLLPSEVRAKSESQVNYLSPKMPWILSIIGVFLVAWTIFVMVAIYNFIF